jgi:hypothetical protein
MKKLLIHGDSFCSAEILRQLDIVYILYESYLLNICLNISFTIR